MNVVALPVDNGYVTLGNLVEKLLRPLRLLPRGLRQRSRPPQRLFRCRAHARWSTQFYQTVRVTALHAWAREREALFSVCLARY